jgi:hypothetical protein
MHIGLYETRTVSEDTESLLSQVRQETDINLQTLFLKKHTFKAITNDILLNLCELHLHKTPYFYVSYRTQPIHCLPR